MPLAPFVEIPQRDPKTGQIVVNPATGKPITAVGVNPIKQFVRGYWLTPAADEIPVTLPASAVSGEPSLPTTLHFTIDPQGHFDWAYIMGISENPFLLEFFDAGCQRKLQNKPVHSNCIVGSSFRPFRLPMPYFFDVGDAQRELQVTLRNLISVENVVHLVMYGRRFYHGEMPPEMAVDIRAKFGHGYREYPYFLQVNEEEIDGRIEVVPGFGKRTFIFEQDDSADVELQKLLFASTKNGTFEFRLRERDKNLRTLATGIVTTTLGFGNAEFPFYFGDSFLLERKKQLILELENLTEEDEHIYPTLAGRRLHYR